MSTDQSYDPPGQQSPGGPTEPPAREAAFHQLLGQALIHPEFLEQLRSPERRGAALASLDIELTPEISARLDEAMEAVKRLSDEFGDIKAAT